MPRKPRPKKHGPRTPQQESQSRGTDFLGSAFRTEDILAINLPPDVRRRTRISKGGKVQRSYTLEIETEPVFHNLDEASMGRGAAEVLAERIGANLLGAAKQAAASTVRFRKAALARLTRGSTDASAGTGAWGRALKKRYSGGRIGYTPPEPPHTQYGVDSGRLARGLFARLNITGRGGERAAWHINVPANRLNREQWGGDKSAFDAWMVEFRRLADVAGAMASPQMQGELYEGLRNAIGTLQATIWRKRRAKLRQQWKVVQGFRLLAVV